MPTIEFRRAVIQAMELDMETARLTYSITGQVGKPITYGFNTQSQVNNAKQKVLGTIARARSKQKGLLIKNADPVPKIDCQADSELPVPKVLAPSTSTATKTLPSKTKPKKMAVVQEKAVALTKTPVFGPKIEPGSSAKLPIDVDFDTPPPEAAKALVKLKFKKSISPSVIVISSDSDSAAGDCDADMSDAVTVDSDIEFPQPAELIQSLAGPSGLHDQPLLALLDELDEHFLGHNFITYAKLFNSLELVLVRDLAERSLTWLLTLTEMEEPSAMILMGAALSKNMLYMPKPGKSKGKEKSKL
ncbi:hypothetical protein RSOLAG1IB_09955 [Rhizoctonia solani AG-1 IB]|uniref:Uncharacterized protein n=1 Tax=Thanatephorus cucumeris (strain AG1-IB / isolate 7/3/14) TaxID=1108050 RepID=A0A0B7FYS2_THACB|nr:hypothetical protein RSOLAG1IB_09955 [Rhizoctonia solani AG-1 IB]